MNVLETASNLAARAAGSKLRVVKLSHKGTLYYIECRQTPVRIDVLAVTSPSGREQDIIGEIQDTRQRSLAVKLALAERAELHGGDYEQTVL